ncbi:MAG: hypothetical protein V3U03_16350 [Myxococcota bacterium]
MQTARIVSLLVALQLAFLSGCSSTVPATVTMRPGGPLQPDAAIFLSARVQQMRIAQSLRDARLTTTDQMRDADYTLEVRVGRSRSNAACGGVNNVAYILTLNGSRVMVIKGRGRTGSCTPSVFDDMSRKLASFAGP